MSAKERTSFWLDNVPLTELTLHCRGTMLAKPAALRSRKAWHPLDLPGVAPSAWGRAGSMRAHCISPRWVDRPALTLASRVALAGPFWRSKQARRSAPKPLESAAGDADVARRRRRPDPCSAKRWPPRARWYSRRPASSASKASCRSDRAASTRADQAAIGSRPKTRISRGRDRLRTTGPHWLLLRLALASRRRRTGGGSSD
jgi:hypothetical protein